jgi:hypothetical protein
MLMYTNPRSKKKPRKPNAAQRELQASWDTMLKKYEPKKVIKSPAKESLSYSLSTPPGRETKRYGSRDTGGYATKKEVLKYTGTKMLGIGTLHKSNAVPVFSDDEPKEMARMRRG